MKTYTIKDINGNDVQLSREEAVYAYVYNMFGVLKECGVLEGGKYQLTDLGKTIPDQLEAQGFKITQDEICVAGAAIWAEAQT